MSRCSGGGSKQPRRDLVSTSAATSAEWSWRWCSFLSLELITSRSRRISTPSSKNRRAIWSLHRRFSSFAKIVLQLVAQRRKEKTICTDILGMLIEARDQKSGRVMPDRQLVNEIKTLVVAGHETTASTLNWIWYFLSQHP